MSTRSRMTWGREDKRASLPVEEADKRASVPPAVPMDPDHPAAKPDPDEHQYENGDTSSWAEDPKPGPYPNSMAPAYPTDTGHPAAKNAAEIRVAVEKKASKCIRIAQTLLPGLDVPTIEDQALEFMDLPDASIDATLRRLEAAHEDEDVLLRKMLAGEEVEDDEEESSGDVEKEASSDHLAEVMAAIRDLQAQVEGLRKPVTAGDDEDEDDDGDDDEATLARLLAEEGMTGKKAEEEEEEVVEEGKEAQDEDEVLLAQMLAEMECDGCNKPAMMEEDVIEDISDPMDMDDMPAPMDAESDISLEMMDDPMGLSDDMSMLPEDDDALASLYHMAGEEEEVVEEDVEEKEAKKAAQRPQPKKAGVGPKTLGAQTVTKTASSEIAELGKLWESAPDVSKYFE